jgi:hypothetical protein
MFKSSRIPVLLILCGFLLACCTKHAAPVGSVESGSGPPCIVYKMKRDYSKHVPVMLNPGKSEITSFPGVRDIYFNGELAYPTRLDDGYFLDNRGIGPDVAFLSYTYEEYSKLTVTQNAGELMNLVLDKDPILEMYDCGNRNAYPDAEKAMNELIRAGTLPGKKKLK